MLTKTKIALVAALVLGVASAAQAGGRDDADQSGGFRLGPTGQAAQNGVNPADHRSLARGAYASAVRTPVRPQAGKNAEAAAPTPSNEPSNITIQDHFFGASLGE